MEITFKCELLSPVVLTSKSATEGFHKSLDYIPGSIFLGIIASKHYSTEAGLHQQTLDLFHNGNVKFGDAHLQLEQNYSFPMPFAWSRKKIDGEYGDIYLHHLLKNNLDKMVQERTGYLSRSGDQFINIDQGFSIKSAYNAGKRRSLDEQMYGYHALPAGLTFLFKVRITNGAQASKYSELIKQGLLGNHHIGRSRSAEYGAIFISEVESITSFLPTQGSFSTTTTATFYAASNWCFFDSYGFPLTILEPSLFGLSKGTINWEKSQLRFRKYQSFNAKRRNPNTAATILSKGSVVVIDHCDVSSLSPEIFVGSWLAEGFGHCLINPSFLFSNHGATRTPPQKVEVALGNVASTWNLKGADTPTNRSILKLLNQRLSSQQKTRHIRNAVAEHTYEYRKISNSQWGLLRGLAKSTNDPNELFHLLFEEPDPQNTQSGGILRRGKSKEVWAPHYARLETFLRESKNPFLALDRLANKNQRTSNE